MVVYNFSLTTFKLFTFNTFNNSTNLLNIHLTFFFHFYSALSLHITSVSVQSLATSVALLIDNTDLKFTIPKKNDTNVILQTSCLIIHSIELYTLTNDQVNPIPNQQLITKI